MAVGNVTVFEKSVAPDILKQASPAFKIVPPKIWEKIVPYLGMHDQTKILFVCRRWKQDLFPLHARAACQALLLLLHEVEKKNPDFVTGLQPLKKKILTSTDEQYTSAFKQEFLVPILFSFVQLCARCASNPLADVDPKLLQVIHLTIGVQGFQKLIHYLSHAYTACPALEKAECCDELLKLTSQAKIYFFCGPTALFRSVNPLSAGQRLVQLVRNEFSNILFDIPEFRDRSYKNLFVELFNLFLHPISPREKLQKIVQVETYFSSNTILMACELISKILPPHDAIFALSYIFASGSLERQYNQQIFFKETFERLATQADSLQTRCSHSQMLIGAARWLPNDFLKPMLDRAFDLKENDFSEGAIHEVALRVMKSTDVQAKLRLLELSTRLKDPFRRLLLLCRLAVTDFSEAQFDNIVKEIQALLLQHRNVPSIAHDGLHRCRLTANYLGERNFARARKLVEAVESLDAIADVQDEHLTAILREAYPAQLPIELTRLTSQYAKATENSRKDLILQGVCHFIGIRSCLEQLEKPFSQLDVLKPYLKSLMALIEMIADCGMQAKTLLTIVDVLASRFSGSRFSDALRVEFMAKLPIEDEMRQDLFFILARAFAEEDIVRAAVYVKAMQDSRRRGMAYAAAFICTLDVEIDDLFIIRNEIEAIDDVAKKDQCVEACVDHFLEDEENNFVPEACTIASLLSKKEKRIQKYCEIFEQVQDQEYFNENLVKEIAHFFSRVEKLAQVADSDIPDQLWEELAMAAKMSGNVTFALSFLEGLTNPAKKELLTAEIFSNIEKKS